MAARVCDGSAAKPWFGGFILGFTSQGSPFHLGDVAESLPPLGLVGAELLWEMLCPGGSCDHPGPAGALWEISGALHEILEFLELGQPSSSPSSSPSCCASLAPLMGALPAV